jgi:alginate O-acetyltransferase complex protein AlgI
MTILQICVLLLVAVIIGRLSRGRKLAILGVSALMVFWLQPDSPIPSLEFWIPFATLGIVVLVWATIVPSEALSWRRNWPAVLVLGCVAALADGVRYFKLDSSLLADAPRLRVFGVALLVLCILTLLVAWSRRLGGVMQVPTIFGLVLIFVVLKEPGISGKIMEWLQTHSGAAAGSSLPTDALMPALQWFGYSYLAFRLLHTLFDRRSGRLPALDLAEYVAYVLFFPALSAGPIDRAERFVVELRAPLPLANDEWLQAGTRVVMGLFKKFVLADALAVISINEQMAPYIRSVGWLWFFVFAYSLRIYFDFSGYTDLAIGMARLLGIQLPENFAAPYLKPNLTQFWNSWHITLTQWFRAYFFNPLVRKLRTSAKSLPVWLIIAVSQTGTMLLIGLWHGITWSFVTWGLWHGVGLFVHNRWTTLVGPRLAGRTESTIARRMADGAGIAMTFVFVSAGWLFFSFTSPAAAWHTLMRMLGAA